jgi:hypothetical protein
MNPITPDLSDDGSRLAAIAVAPAQEDQAIERLIRFSWDSHQIRVARVSGDWLVVDLGGPLDPLCRARLSDCLGQPVQAFHGSPSTWRLAYNWDEEM